MDCHRATGHGRESSIRRSNPTAGRDLSNLSITHPTVAGTEA
ncbi:hypothetical protein QIS74_00096 [Colletotrichum tabaci]|uniref:Uncharacterized protein n=1 Tax=Colletotrichum tabaci TaxID=1209068 RepID=A0AAV9TSQ5_9PEZI